MGFLTKAINGYETGANYQLGHSLSSTSVSSLFGNGGKDINVLEEYSGFAWKAINVRAEVLADQLIFVERKVGDKYQQDPNHEFNKVLDGDTGQVDLSELLEAHEKSMCLYGESFWYFSKGEKFSKPISVYLLDPSAMTVMVAGRKVTGYVYQKDEEKITLDIDEVDHYKVYDPRHPFRGTGAMQSAGWFIRSARYVNTYVNNFLENSAIPAGVVVAETADDKDWELFKAQWQERYSGIENAGKTGFVRGSGLDFVKTGLSLGEVDFEKIKNTSRDDIMVMFGVSKPMMAIFDDINRASATTARQLFAITLTSPALKRIQRKLSKKVAMWYGLQYRIGTSNPIPEDVETKLNAYDKGVGRWFTINEARAAYGLEAIKDGDVIEPAVAPKQTDNTKSYVVKPKTIGNVTIKRSTQKTEFSYEMKEDFRSQTEDIQLKYEQSFLSASNKVLTEQRDAVIGQLQPKKVVDARFDASKEAEKLAHETLSVLVGLASEQGALAARFAGNKETKFTLSSVMEKYIADSIAKASLGFTKDTQDKIAEQLAEGLNAGESLAKIGKRINSIYEEVLGVKTAGYRIERLARTEVIKTSNEITEAAYKQSGVVKKKEWLANPGACEFCKAINGSVINLDSNFSIKGETITGVDGGTRINSYEDVKHPPVHPACRCTLIPVIEDMP